jgi:hypothetical protein
MTKLRSHDDSDAFGRSRRIWQRPAVRRLVAGGAENGARKSVDAGIDSS